MPATPSASDNRKAILLMVAAMAGFILNDTFIKVASEALPTGQVIFLRGLLATPLILLIAWRLGALGRLASLRNRFVGWRTVGEMGSTALYLTALFNMPLANATAILQIVPLLTTAAAAIFLGERVGVRRWSAVALGLLGVLLIIRPGLEGFNAWSLVALAAMTLGSQRPLLLRDRGGRSPADRGPDARNGPTGRAVPSGEPDALRRLQRHLSVDSGLKLPASNGRMRVLEKKHPLAIRWFHWINFPLLALMIWSGILIYWAYPAYLKFDQKLWRALHINNRLAEGMALHFFFMWFFAINGVAYVLYTLISGEWRELVPNRHSFREAWNVLLHDLHIRTKDRLEAGATRKFNGAQQIAYTMVILMGAGSLLSGLAIYKPVQFAWLVWLFGGYQTARFVNFALTVGYVLFFLVHVAQVIRAGWNNFRAMVIGYEVREVSE